MKKTILITTCLSLISYSPLTHAKATEDQCLPWENLKANYSSSTAKVDGPLTNSTTWPAYIQEKLPSAFTFIAFLGAAYVANKYFNNNNQPRNDGQSDSKPQKSQKVTDALKKQKENKEKNSPGYLEENPSVCKAVKNLNQQRSGHTNLLKPILQGKKEQLNTRFNALYTALTGQGLDTHALAKALSSATLSQALEYLEIKEGSEAYTSFQQLFKIKQLYAAVRAKLANLEGRAPQRASDVRIDLTKTGENRLFKESIIFEEEGEEGSQIFATKEKESEELTFLNKENLPISAIYVDEKQEELHDEYLEQILEGKDEEGHGFAFASTEELMNTLNQLEMETYPVEEGSLAYMMKKSDFSLFLDEENEGHEAEVPMKKELETL